MPLSFEKPLGTKDVLPEKLILIREITAKSKDLLEKWGYEEIETPVIEYHQTVGLYSKIQEEKLIKFLDPTGKTVILKPDLTTPIARFVSSVYRDVEFPIRLMYQGKVYRNLGSHGIEEINQLGLELLGLENLEADAEVITLAVKTILKSTNSDFKVSIGHTKFLRLLFKEIGCDEIIENQLFQYLLTHDYVGFKDLVNKLSISDQYKTYLQKILKFRGDLNNILEAKSWFSTSDWHNVFHELSGLWEILTQYELADYVCYDLSHVGRQNYYTGLIYNVYCAGHPYPICSGGRYDGLLASFDRPAPATGFAINMDDLVRVIIKEQGPAYCQDKTLLIYSPKNRLPAIKRAEELRKQGKIVIMALENTVTENYIKGFGEIIKSS